jgi:hypothetical protein
MCAKPDLDDQGRVISEPQYQEWIVEGTEFEQWRQRWWARVEQYYQSHA